MKTTPKIETTSTSSMRCIWIILELTAAVYIRNESENA